MISKKVKLFFFGLFIFVSGTAQSNFHILNNKNSVSIPFALVNNLMVIKVNVNGKELSLLVDTGIDKTILFNLKFKDSLSLNNTEKIELRGLGEGDPIIAIKSRNNVLQIKDAVSTNQMIYLIIDSQLDLSAKMGFDIHGIIGGELFQDFIVRINYSAKKMTLFNPDTYKYKNCKNCLTLPIEFYHRKPLVNVFVENHLNEKFEVKLLIDSGGGDALWLFENTHDLIKVPENHFDDILGKGLSGDIYGKRSKIKKIIIGDYIIDNASVSYPDSTSILTVHNNKDRNGTIGAEILKRFHIIFDYANKKITLKKNGLYFNTPFLYNKSGMEVVYNGDMMVKEKNNRFVNYELKEKENLLFSEVMSIYNLAYKPRFEIAHLRDKSPAKIAGLKVGDVLMEINGRPAYDYKLYEIIKILSAKENKKIKLLVDRDGQHLKYEFNLKSLL